MTSALQLKSQRIAGSIPAGFTFGFFSSPFHYFVFGIFFWLPQYWLLLIFVKSLKCPKVEVTALVSAQSCSVCVRTLVLPSHASIRAVVVLADFFNWKLNRNLLLVYGQLNGGSLFDASPKTIARPFQNSFSQGHLMPLDLLIWTCNQHLDDLPFQNLLECLLCFVERHLTGDQLLHIDFTARH